MSYLQDSLHLALWLKARLYSSPFSHRLHLRAPLVLHQRTLLRRTLVIWKAGEPRRACCPSSLGESKRGSNLKGNERFIILPSLKNRRSMGQDAGLVFRSEMILSSCLSPIFSLRWLTTEVLTKALISTLELLVWLHNVTSKGKEK